MVVRSPNGEGREEVIVVAVADAVVEVKKRELVLPVISDLFDWPSDDLSLKRDAIAERERVERESRS